MKILENNGTFESADGKTTIHYVELKNENIESYKGVVVCVHGIGEHKMRRMNLMQQLVDKGYVVFSYDCIGHGESVATGQAKMYFSKWDYVVKDFQTMCHFAKEKYLNIPCFAFGFSMGSFIVRTAITKEYSTENEILEGAIFAGTGALSPFVARFMAKIVNKIALSSGR